MKLYRSIDLVPYNVRLGLALIKKEVLLKYPKMTNVIPSMLFLRFLSPTILQPQSYCVTTLPIGEITPSLLALTKLFQSIANGIPKANITNLTTVEPSIIFFINKHVPKLEKFCNTLTDSIGGIKNVSMTPESKSSSQSRKLAALKQVSQYINYEFFPNETKNKMLVKESSSDTSDSRTHENKIEKVVGKLQDIRGKSIWSVLKEDRSMTIHRAKRDQLYIYKLDVLFSGLSVEEVYKSIMKASTTHYQFPVQARKIESFGKEHLDIYYKFYFPFPFSYRDFVCKGVGRILSDDEAQFFLVPHKRSDHPKEKGVVRGSLEAGYFIERSENIIRVVSIAIVDAKGSLPKWGSEKAVLAFMTSFMNDKHIKESFSKSKVKLRLGIDSQKDLSPSRKSKRSKLSFQDKIEPIVLSTKYDEASEDEYEKIAPIVIRGRMRKATSTTAIPRVTFAENPRKEHSVRFDSSSPSRRPKSTGPSKKKSRDSRSASPGKSKKKGVKTIT